MVLSTAVDDPAVARVVVIQTIFKELPDGGIVF